MAWEGEKDFSKMYSSYFQLRRAKKRRPFHERELIYSVSDIAKTLGLSETSIYRYRRLFFNFPRPITSKAAVRNWARHRVPLKRGPLPSEIRRIVVRMRGEGKRFRQIGKILGISHQAAHQHWKRHLKVLVSKQSID